MVHLQLLSLQKKKVMFLITASIDADAWSSGVSALYIYIEVTNVLKSMEKFVHTCKCLVRIILLCLWGN